MNKSIQKYILENLHTILKLLIIYLVGIVIGIILFNLSNIKTDYVDIVKNVFDSVNQENFKSVNVILNGLKNNVLFIGLLYLSLITLIAPIAVCVLLMLKAIITGIYICCLFSVFGVGSGLIAVFLSVILPLIFTLSAYIFISNNIINIYISFTSDGKIEFKDIVKNIYWLIISFSLISFSLVLEQVMTGIIFNYTKVYSIENH